MSVLRLRAPMQPKFPYPYLLDVAAIDMASSLMSATEKDRHRQKRQRAVAAEVERMYSKWTLTLWRRPKLVPSGVQGIRRPREMTERERCTLLIDAAFVEPFGAAGLLISDDERRLALRSLAGTLDLEPAWADRSLQVITGVTTAQKGRRRGQSLTKKDAAALLAGTLAGGVGATGGEWLLGAARRRGDRKAASATAAMLAGLGAADVAHEVVRMLTHTIVVETETLGQEHITGEALTALAERRAELAAEAERLRELECPKAEIENAEESERAVRASLDWLVAQ